MTSFRHVGLTRWIFAFFPNRVSVITLALHLKLDELIIATKAARNGVAGIEEVGDEILEAAKDVVQVRASINKPK